MTKDDVVIEPLEEFEIESEAYATRYSAEKLSLEWWNKRNAFQKGAMLGYNKAKVEMQAQIESMKEDYELLLNEKFRLEDTISELREWHYPSKDEYPDECKNVWCYCKGLGIKFCCVGHIIINGNNKVRWWANNKSEELRVIAWKEIVLPEEE